MNTSFNKPVSAFMLIKFAIPTILSMILLNTFLSVDKVFVARMVSVEALAAVNLVWPLVNAVLAVGSMLAMGGSALIAKKKGEGKIVEARQNFTLIIMFGVIASALISFVILVFDTAVLRILGVDYYMHDLARDYMFPLGKVAPAPILGVMFSQLMITDGKPTLGGISVALGAILSTVLNWVFISRLDMGISGAAYATGIGYSLPTLIGIVYFTFSRKRGIYFVKPKWDFFVITKSSAIGISEFITLISISIVTTVINNRLMDIDGPLSVAAIAAILGVQNILMAIFMGYSFGIAPIVSHSFGAGDTGRLRKIYKISLTIMGILSVSALAIGLIFTSPLIRIYFDISNPFNIPPYELAKDGFRIVSLGFIFMGVSVFATSWFTALNDALVSGLMSICRTLVFILISVLVFSHFWGVDGIWWGIPFAEVPAIIMSIFFLVKMNGRYKYVKQYNAA